MGNHWFPWPSAGFESIEHPVQPGKLQWGGAAVVDRPTSANGLVWHHLSGGPFKEGVASGLPFFLGPYTPSRSSVIMDANSAIQSINVSSFWVDAWEKGHLPSSVSLDTTSWLPQGWSSWQYIATLLAVAVVYDQGKSGCLDTLNGLSN